MADISKITLPSGTTYDIKDAVARQMISGGVSFIIAWNGSDTPVADNIPAGISVGSPAVVGTLSTTEAQAGAFYLVYSDSETNSEDDGSDRYDVYDEYVVIKPTTDDSTTWFWEKIGDTKLSLQNIVTDVTLNKQTDTAIGTDSTFTVTQPTISMSTSASSGTGKVPIVTGITSVTPGGNDSVTAVTGYANPTTGNFVQTLASTSRKLATTIVTGVSGSTTASKATAAASQTTAKGTATASTVNSNILKNVSVSNETLIIGACTLDTQTTTQQTFSDITVPVAAGSATTVATGSTTTTGSGASLLTAIGAGSTAAAMTGLGTPTTDTVLGVDTTFGGQASTAYLGGSATGGNVAWNNKDTVTALINTTTITVEKGGE